MTSRLVFATGILGCVLAACGAESSDEGMYKLALTLRTQDSTPLDSLPTTVSWSSTTDLALRFIDAQHARVEVFGQRVDPDPYPVRARLGGPPTRSPR
jgi:hypothetical protein